MRGCSLCLRAVRLLKAWEIKYKPVYDDPILDREYPYITIELEYEELVDWIAKGKLI